MSNKLYIISGHGAGDSGAVGNGYQEAERVRALATKIKEYGSDNVILADFNINSYKSNIIGKGLVPKDSLILELHLDSSTNKSAKGGHVIINADFKADKYDERLATMISTMFPGRSQIIVGRTDLANVNRAAECGYNYRLMECCFISNADDIKKFNASLDLIAKEILKCFDIAVIESKPTVAKKSNTEIAKEVLAGKWGNGSARKDNLTKAGYNYAEVQAEVNKLVKGTTATPKVNYFLKYNGNSTSIVTALNTVGAKSTFAYRKEIAKKNGIKLYVGTANQNTTMLNLLKQGKLIKP